MQVLKNIHSTHPKNIVNAYTPLKMRLKERPSRRVNNGQTPILSFRTFKNVVQYNAY